MHPNLLVIISGIFVVLSLLTIAVFLIRKKLKFEFMQGIEVKTGRLILPSGILISAVTGLAVMPYLEVSDVFSQGFVRFFNVLMIAAIGYMGIMLVQIFKSVILSRYDIGVSDNLQARRIYTQIGVMQSIINVGIIVLTISCMIMIFPRMRQIGVSLLASAGVMGIVLGFAAQRTLGNLIAGVQIAITQPVRIDDVLVVEGEWGWVEEITLTYVVVRIWDLRRLILPISYFIEKPFQNWTRTSADILGTVYIYADYTVDIGKVREELTRILENSPHWDKKVNVLQVTNATEKTVELRALMSAKDSPTAWKLRCEVREKLLIFLQKNHPGFLPRIRLEMDKDQK